MRAEPRYQEPPLLNFTVLLFIGGLVLIWGLVYLMRVRYHYTSRQLEEMALYLVIGGTTVVGGTLLVATRRWRREREWPHPPMVVSPQRDGHFTRAAWSQNAVVLGYDIHHDIHVGRGCGRTRSGSCKGSCSA